MARKKKHEEHVNHERWLVSYADFITLLFAFFVVMYAISSVNEGKYRVLSDSLVAAFRSTPKSMDPIQVGNPAKSPATQTQDQRHKPLIVLPPVPNMLKPDADTQPGKKSEPAKEPRSQTAQLPAEQTPATEETRLGPGTKSATQQPSAEQNSQQALLPQQREAPTLQRDAHQQNNAQALQVRDPFEAIQEMADNIERAMGPLVEKDLIAIKRTRHWVEVEIKASILFASGSARLERAALPVLEKLAQILAPFPNTLHVEGFTDNQPIRTLVFPSNWELSAMRAASVVHLFAQSGVRAERMAVIGYGELRPVADNATELGRSKNRRVVLVILAEQGAKHDLQNAKERPAHAAPAGEENTTSDSSSSVMPVLREAPQALQPPATSKQLDDKSTAVNPAQRHPASSQPVSSVPKVARTAPYVMPAPVPAMGSKAPAGKVTAKEGTDEARQKDPHEPIDVTSQEVTERGTFIVIPPPIETALSIGINAGTTSDAARKPAKSTTSTFKSLLRLEWEEDKP